MCRRLVSWAHTSTHPWSVTGVGCVVVCTSPCRRCAVLCTAVRCALVCAAAALRCLVCCMQELRERFTDVAQAAAEASYFSGQDAQGGVLAHLAAKLAAKLKVCWSCCCLEVAVVVVVVFADVDSRCGCDRGCECFARPKLIVWSRT